MLHSVILQVGIFIGDEGQEGRKVVISNYSAIVLVWEDLMLEVATVIVVWAVENKSNYTAVFKVVDLAYGYDRVKKDDYMAYVHVDDSQANFGHFVTQVVKEVVQSNDKMLVVVLFDLVNNVVGDGTVVPVKDEEEN